MDNVRFINEKARMGAEFNRELQQAVRSVSLVAAVLVGPAGGKRLVALDIVDGDGLAEEAMKEYVEEVRPSVGTKCKLITVKYQGLRPKDLEAAASHVKVLD